jgi:uncharacterized protein (UPF0332 family)
MINFKWEEFLHVARDLAQSAATQNSAPKREAMHRSAVSRAYYASFGTALQWLQTNFPNHPLPAHGEIHQSVIDFFGFSNDETFVEIAKLMRRLRQRRNEADYKSQLNGLEQMAQNAIFDANRVLNALSGLEPS